MTGLIIFGLLTVLMLTGMPISIALGLTVLTFLFTMTDVPLESVGLKLFTGIEKFEIMAIPFLWSSNEHPLYIGPSRHARAGASKGNGLQIFPTVPIERSWTNRS